ncbi:MAG: YvcK family protein [Chloroflexi bacterium]|nr:YvcK family protein [Chloroflexota bacterium]MCI0577605.1 YvcK family protein [Chloroflexota bacterium]MCI0644175.1 YvcK family protein [Chloroflexota bacterium]MCI0725242.1 YvcK family protein [Chloroflexota bacterium]
MNERSSLGKAWTLSSRWLTPGMGIKRWLAVLGLGAMVVGMGVGSFIIALRQENLLPADVYDLLTLQFLPVGLRVLLPLLTGSLIMFVAILRLGANLVAPFRRPGEEVVDSLYDYSQRNRGPQVVAIGGGTGMPSLLRGLTRYTSNITAIVTVADDGGSSGRLRRELGVLPPGDFRNNIAALARDEALMTQLLQYRFGSNVSPNGSPDGDGQERGELQGHAFGNLLLAALAGITGSFDEALVAAERVLAMRGRVLPSTLANVALVAEVAVGEAASRRVVGESAIPKAGGRIRRVSLEPANAPAYPAAMQAILQADLVVIGPGSLYTSILPNLLVTGIASALRRTRATRVYVCNLATQPGETDNYSVSDHVVAIQRHMPAEKGNAPGWVDVVLANGNLSIPSDAGGGHTVFVQPVGPKDVKMVTADLVDEQRPWRHDSAKLAWAVMSLGFKR